MTTRSARRRTSRRTRSREQEDPGAVRRFRFRHPTASGKTIAAAGFVEAARTMGVLILTHRRLLVQQFTRDLTTEGYGDRLRPAIEDGPGATPRQSDHDPDVRVVRAPRRLDLEERLPARHLRRGAHGPRREDEHCHPPLRRADLHRHDRDGAADREAGLGRLPGLGRRPPARATPRAAGSSRRCAACGSRRPRRSRRCRSSAATTTRRSWPASSTTRSSTRRPRASTATASTRRRGSSTRPASSTPTTSRASSAPRDSRRRPSAARHRRSSSPRRSPPTSAARSTSSSTRMLLAEGWNSPRATVCMHLAPTASRRVYQQRIGRDHAHASAQGGRRRRRLRPRRGDAQRAHDHAPLPARRGLLPPWRARHPGAAQARSAPRAPQALAGAVARSGHSRLRVAASRVITARMGAGRSRPARRGRAAPLGAGSPGRQLRFEERQHFAEKLAKASRECREAFLMSCAAENPNRRLRLSALGDRVAVSVDRASFDDLVTMVTSAPTWEKDRVQGVRILLRAIGEGKVDAPEEILSRWTWRLARATRKLQDRRAGVGPAGGEAPPRRARRTPAVTGTRRTPRGSSTSRSSSRSTSPSRCSPPPRPTRRPHSS